MAFTPTAGQYALIKYTPSGGSQVTPPAINWTLSDAAKNKDVSNFRDGRVRAPTLPDADLSFTLVWDSNANPTLPANGGIARGTFFSANLYTDPLTTKPIVYNGVVETISPKNEGVEGVLMFDVTAKQSGAATTYPTS